MKGAVSLEDAVELLLGLARPTAVQSTVLEESRDLALAETVFAPIPLPPFDRSPLDGYAIRAEDMVGATDQNPVSLLLDEKILPGCAVPVATGSPIPPGANAVIRWEDVSKYEGKIEVATPLQAGDNIIRAGSDVPLGQEVLPAGTTVNPPVMALLGALGFGKVRVHARPRVAIFTTGDELEHPGLPLLPGKVYDCALPALEALVREAGGEPVYAVRMPDDMDILAVALRQGFMDADLVLTAGGISAGEKDLVPAALAATGGETLFRGINIKPGSPALGGRHGSRLFLGLSGNPGAAIISFLLSARPVIRRLGGHRDLFLSGVSARLRENPPKQGLRRRFIRGMVRWEENGYTARLAGSESPGSLLFLTRTNALLEIPAGSDSLGAGDQIKALLLPWPVS